MFSGTLTAQQEVFEFSSIMAGGDAVFQASGETLIPSVSDFKNNPSLLVNTKLSMAVGFGDLVQFYNIKIPTQYGNFALDFKKSAEHPLVEFGPSTGEEFTKDNTFTVGYGINIMKKFNMGANVKFFSWQETHVFFDIGFTNTIDKLFMENDKLIVGTSLNNLGNELNYKTTTYKIPSYFRTNALFDITPVSDFNLNLSLQYSQLLNPDVVRKKRGIVSMGTQLSLWDAVFIRGGYIFNGQPEYEYFNRDKFNWGGGIKVSFNLFKYRLSSYLDYSTIKYLYLQDQTAINLRFEILNL